MCTERLVGMKNRLMLATAWSYEDVLVGGKFHLAQMLFLQRTHEVPLIEGLKEVAMD
jgi:hypothetical protein